MINNHLSREEQSKTELENCDFCKVILMLLIVFYHSMYAFRTAGWYSFDVQHSIVVDVIVGFLNTILVPTFVLISGYLFAYLKFEKGRYNNLKSFLCNKIMRLIIPYSFVSIIWVIPIDLILFEFDLNTIIYCYVLGGSPSQLWFLLMLFWVFVVMYFMADLVKNKPVFALIAISAISLVTIIMRNYLYNYFQILSIGNYLLIFACGMLMRLHSTTYLRKIPCWLYFFMQISIYSMYCLMPRSNAVLKILSMGLGYSLKIMGAIVGFIVLTSLALYIKPDATNRLFKFLMKNNFTIYLFHQQVIYFTLILFSNTLPIGIHIAINAICALTVSSLIAHMFNTFKSTKFIIGSK